MKLSEILISKADRLIDKLKYEGSERAYTIYGIVEDTTNNFSMFVRDVYSIDEIMEFNTIIKHIMEDPAFAVFSESDALYIIMSRLSEYFINA